jgi:hypothetical protein
MSLVLAEKRCTSIFVIFARAKQISMRLQVNIIQQRYLDQLLDLPSQCNNMTTIVPRF